MERGWSRVDRRNLTRAGWISLILVLAAFLAWLAYFISEIHIG